MRRRFLSSTLLAFLVIIFINWGCTKLDTTNIGSDLLPDVDNINTFADTLDIITTQGAFEGAIYQDSTKLSVSNPVESYVVGKTNDPIFGGTTARLFLQLKPTFYPYFFGISHDTLTALDSVVLCLSYKGVYGDTTQPIKLQVSEVDHNAHGEWDSLGTYSNPSLRTINYAPAIGQLLSDETPVDLNVVRSNRKIGKGSDSVMNQIRIKLNNATFNNLLYHGDSITGEIFSRDTLFRAFTNGFAITMTQGNALLFTELNDEMTRLEIHYKRKNGIVDTSYSKFTYNNGIGGSAAPRRGAVANNIVHDRSVAPLPTGDQEIYLQSSPGTYANLHIPELNNYSNRIIHRAEIIMEQIPGDPVTDGYFAAPSFLYMDLVDTGNLKWKPIYYDLNPSVSYDPDSKTGNFDYFPYTGEVDFSYFGGTPKTKTDIMGTRKYYTLNVSRYVQQLVTKQTHNYDMRLFAPHSFYYPQYQTTPSLISYVNNIAYGRVRLGGGNNTNPYYKMKLRIIYSPLK